MNIFVFGSLAYDRIMDFPGKFSDYILPEKIHILNVCFLVNGLEEKFGGTAGNIAYSLALLEEKPLILASAGKDFDRYEKWLREHGLSLEGIRYVPEEFTAGAYITTDKSDNQITGFNPGAMKHQVRYDFTRVDPGQALAIVSPGNLQDMRELPRTFRDLKIPFIMDPGQNIPAFTGEQLLDMIAGSSILISNDYELELIMKATGRTRAELLDLTGAIITTMAERGSVVVGKDGETHVGVATVENPLDPTGAGDGYRAGLIKGLSMGKTLPEAAAVGATCASFCVELHGTQEHLFTLEEFWTRHKESFGG